jgi:hypothetical protein
MEAARFRGTFAPIYRTARCHIPEEYDPNTTIATTSNLIYTPILA